MLFPALLLLTRVICSPSLQAGEDEPVSEEITTEQSGTTVTAKLLVDEGNNLYFKHNLDSLSKGNFHAAAQVYSAPEFRQSAYANWDIEHITDKLNADELVVLIKSAVVFPGKSPGFFVQENALSEKYLEAVSENNKIYSINLEKSQVFLGKTYYLLYKITSIVDYKFYDLINNSGIRINRKQVDNAIDIFKISVQAANMIASSALAENISFGSYGMRSYSFYSSLHEGKDTLALNFKLVTIKKEERYSSLAWRMLGVWDKVGKRAREEILKGNQQTQKMLARLPLDISKAKDKKAKH